MLSISTAQDLSNRERGLRAALQGLNPKDPQFDTIAARMTDAFNRLRTDVASFDDPTEQMMLKGRLKTIEEGLIHVRISKDLDIFATDLQTIEGSPENQESRAVSLLARIHHFINHKAHLLSPDQRQQLAETEKRADDLVPESPEARKARLTRSYANARGLRAVLRKMRDSFRKLTLLERDAKSLFIEYRKTHEKRGMALTKGIWEAARRKNKKFEHFGSKVMHGDSQVKMPTKDILAVIDHQLKSFPAGKNKEKQKLQNLRQAILDQRAFLRASYDQLRALDPEFTDMLVGYVREEIEPRKAGYRTEAVLTGEIFSDPRVIIAALNRMIESLSHAKGHCPFPLLTDSLICHLGQFLETETVRHMRNTDTRFNSGILMRFSLDPLRAVLDKKIQTLTPLPITREVRELFFIRSLFRGCCTIGKDYFLETIAKDPSASFSLYVCSNQELNSLVSAFAPMNGGGLMIVSPNLTRISDRLGQLRGLHSLDIQCENLEEFPPSIGQLTELRSLRIGYIPKIIKKPFQLFHFPSSYENLLKLRAVHIDDTIDTFTHFRILIDPSDAEVSDVNTPASDMPG